MERDGEDGEPPGQERHERRGSERRAARYEKRGQSEARRNESCEDERQLQQVMGDHTGSVFILEGAGITPERFRRIGH